MHKITKKAALYHVALTTSQNVSRSQQFVTESNQYHAVDMDHRDSLFDWRNKH